VVSWATAIFVGRSGGGEIRILHEVELGALTRDINFSS